MKALLSIAVAVSFLATTSVQSAHAHSHSASCEHHVHSGSCEHGALSGLSERELLERRAQAQLDEAEHAYRTGGALLGVILGVGGGVIMIIAGSLTTPVGVGVALTAAGVGLAVSSFHLFGKKAEQERSRAASAARTIREIDDILEGTSRFWEIDAGPLGIRGSNIGLRASTRPTGASAASAAGSAGVGSPR